MHVPFRSAMLGAAVFASACATGPTTTPTAGPATVPNAGATVVKIGHVAPLTGVISNLGVDNERGAMLAIEELNAQHPQIGGRPVVFELVRENDQGERNAGVAAAQRLVQARVSGVVGHLNSGTSVPAARVYADAGIPAITPSATNPKLTRQGFPTAFRLIADDIQNASALARVATKEFGARRIAIVDDRTAYGQGIADAFEKAVQAEGGSIAKREYTRSDATDFATIIASLGSVKPDLVFYSGMDSDAGPLLRQMREAGLQARLLGPDGICSADLPRLSSQTSGNDKVYCSEPGSSLAEPAPPLADFGRRFARRFGSPPHVFAPNAYDAVRVLAAAMTVAGSWDPKVYLPTLAHGPHPDGVTGPIAFDEIGNLKQAPIILYTYRDGNRVTLGERK